MTSLPSSSVEVASSRERGYLRDVLDWHNQHYFAGTIVSISGSEGLNVPNSQENIRYGWLAKASMGQHPFILSLMYLMPTMISDTRPIPAAKNEH